MLVVDVGPNAEARSCRVVQASGEPRLDRAACDSIVRRARFHAFYAAPGQSVSSRWDYAVYWKLTDEPPPPVVRPMPAPRPQFTVPGPGRWPRSRWFGEVLLTELPRIQADFPAAATADGVVSLDLVVTADKGIEGCRIGIGSGDPALDAAACRVVRSVQMRYPRPCEICPPHLVPLQVHWRRSGGSHIRGPLSWTSKPGSSLAVVKDPADSRTATFWRAEATPLPFTLPAGGLNGIRKKTITNTRLVTNLEISSNGRILACGIGRSTGDPRIDRRACELLIKHARYAPATDVFGDPLPVQPRIKQNLDVTPQG